MTEFSADLGPNVRAYLGFVTSPAFAALPGELRERILEEAPNVGSPVVHFAALTELLYAERANLPLEGKRLGAQVAFLCRVHGFHGLGSGRGWAIQQAMQRDAGDPPPDGHAWPDPAADPDAAA